ncbi:MULTISPECIES: type II toxin-antitoxin system RelB/DinJ family antitoxin [unclassified Moraxella]|uniref:type II toxin-antitoxin system RelB/DinJ family antitoxin n=1 Tax=unclassified Moraxella TaxID=2685852 RepID=UPI003AF61EE6
MTAQTSMLHIRIDDDIKQQAQSTLKELGMSMSEAVRFFLTRVVNEQGMPFDMKVPNASTSRALQESEEIIQRQQARFTDADALFDELEQHGK